MKSWKMLLLWAVLEPSNADALFIDKLEGEENKNLKTVLETNTNIKRTFLGKKMDNTMHFCRSPIIITLRRAEEALMKHLISRKHSLCSKKDGKKFKLLEKALNYFVTSANETASSLPNQSNFDAGAKKLDVNSITNINFKVQADGYSKGIVCELTDSENDWPTSGLNISWSTIGNAKRWTASIANEDGTELYKLIDAEYGYQLEQFAISTSFDMRIRGLPLPAKPLFSMMRDVNCYFCLLTREDSFVPKTAAWFWIEGLEDEGLHGQLEVDDKTNMLQTVADMLGLDDPCTAMLKKTIEDRDALFVDSIQADINFKNTLNLLVPYGYDYLMNLANLVNKVDALSNKVEKVRLEKVEKNNNNGMVIAAFSLIAAIEAVDSSPKNLLIQLKSITVKAYRALTTLDGEAFVVAEYVNDKADKGLIQRRLVEELGNPVQDTAGQLASMLNLVKVYSDLIPGGQIHTGINRLTEKADKADRCYSNMRKALQKLKGEASGEASGEARSIAGGAFAGMHTAARCWWEQKTDELRQWIGGKLAQMVLYTDVKEDGNVMLSLFNETARLYSSGLIQTEDEWNVTVACATKLVDASKQLSMVAAKGLQETSGKVKWMNSPLCPEVTNKAYIEASLHLRKLFREQMIDQAAEMVSLNGDESFHLLRESIVKDETNDIFTATFILSTGAQPDDQSKKLLKHLNSMATLWARKSNVLQKVKLIGWILIFLSQKSNDIKQNFVTMWTEGAYDSVVKHFKPVWITLCFLREEWTAIKTATVCYEEIADKNNNVMDEDALVAAVVEDDFCSVYNMTIAGLLSKPTKLSPELKKHKVLNDWLEERKARFQKALKKRVLQNMYENGKLNRKLKGQLGELLEYDDFSNKDKEVETLWNAVKASRGKR
eukprot:GHVS01053678.1.p1 GENE.GHVS01053678.1~~GHVS01053678.1.p1  ORF type:complete len:889 (+),score=89.31 GHVS01053678.1:115-2781(+)